MNIELNDEISPTGYWNGETAHIHHVHSEPLANWIVEFLKDKDQQNNTIYDLGCGEGHYINALEEEGFFKIVGIEGDIPKTAVSNFIEQHDLTTPLPAYFKPGNVLSLEVAEHIPTKYQSNFLDNIVKLCNGYLIMSWAIRGQAGFGHVNCLDNNEVVKLIEDLGFTFLFIETTSARDVIDDTTPWFRNTILIFKKNG